MDKLKEYVSDEGNYSSISSTSGCEDEDADLQRLNQSTDAEKQRFLLFETYLKQTNADIQKNQLQRNGHANFEKLLKRNIFLEDELYKAKLQIETARRNGNLGDKLVLYEKENKFLAENEQLRKEKNHLKQQIFITQGEYKNLKQKHNELGISHECKESSIIQLKEKIKEQQENIEKLIQRNLKYNNELSEYQNELITSKKCAEWYKTQWHNNQIDKNAMLKEIFDLKSCVTNKNDEIGRMNVLLTEIKVQQRQEYECMQKKWREEMRKYPILESNQIPNGHESFDKNEIESLTKEINSLKEMLAEQTDLLAVIMKEKSGLVQRNAMLQTLVNDKELRLQTYENSKQEAEEIIANYDYNIKEKEQRLMYVKNEVNKLRIAFDSSSKEKQSVHESVNLVRSGFQKFLSMHEELKDELKEKNKLIYMLEKEIQEGFMGHNWNKCAIEEYKAKETSHLLQINGLNNAIAKVAKNNSALDDEKGKLLLELKEIKKMYKDLLAINEQLTKNVAKEEVEKGKSELETTANNKIEFYKKTIETLNVGEDSRHHNVEVVNTFCHKFRIKVNSFNLQEILDNIELLLNNSTAKLASAEDLIEDLRRQVRNLLDALQIKEMALRDKQERYELYHRTLLRQVKGQLTEKRKLSKENTHLKAQLHIATESINTTLKLQLHQRELHVKNAVYLLSRKNEHIKMLKGTTQSLENLVQENDAHTTNLHNDSLSYKLKLDVNVEMSNEHRILRNKCDDFVSCHSNCSSSNCIETDRNTLKLQEKLDFCTNEVKIANCTINEQSIQLEKLQIEKTKAIELIRILEKDHLQLIKYVRSLVNEKSFLQRLIIDLKAALNATTCKTKIKSNVKEYESLPVKLDTFSLSSTIDENEITSILARSASNNRKPLIDLQKSLIGLKMEMSKMQKQISSSLH